MPSNNNAIPRKKNSATVLTEIYLTELTPLVSYLLEPGERRYSLSLDISEVFKPIIVDRVIFNMINNRIIKEENFVKELNFCYTKTKVKAFPLISAASRISLCSSCVGTLSRAYRLIVGSIRFIFFQLRTTSFISRNNLTALSQLLTVPAVIIPLSILNLSCDRRVMIFFSAAGGLWQIAQIHLAID
jgi:hypothetical protein